MPSDFPQALLWVASTIIFYAFLSWLRNSSTLRDIRGPKPGSFWLGSLPDLWYQAEVGDVEYQWLAEYGGAWKITGAFGAEHLLLADPKAIQHVVQASGYLYPKRTETRIDAALVTGEGVAWAEGAQHQKQRRIMEPAFSVSQLRSLVPTFARHAEKLAQKWKDRFIAMDPDGSPIINVHRWLSRTTLDVIGEAGLGFAFGALDNYKNPLSEVYDDLFIDVSLYPSRFELLYRGLWRFLPKSLWRMVLYTPGPQMARFRHYLAFVRGFSHELLAESEKGEGKDIMSVLLRANSASDARNKLSRDEVIEQLSTLLVAGHDTTSTTLSWWLWEMAKNPSDQTRVRNEIKAARAHARELGDGEFTVADHDSMAYLNATLKETLRLHPIGLQLLREAAKDDVIPLAFPITTKSGQTISTIPVKKGQFIDVRMGSYNRYSQVWGLDAHQWRPERFLEMEKTRKTNVGMYANVMTFSAGNRGCIGWRFALYEMQAIAITLLENFEFALPPQTEKTRIKRMPAMVMSPMAECEDGAWMGLRVKNVA